MRTRAVDHSVPVFLLAGLAALLFAFAFYLLGARLAQMPGDAAREALLNKEKISDAALDDLARSRARAAAWRAAGGTLSDLSMAAFERASRKGLDLPAAAADIQEALRWQEKALGRAPSDSYGWTQLSYMIYLTEGISERAAWAFARSVETNPFEPRLMAPRVTMAIRLHDKLDEDTKASVPSMIREAWDVDPYETAMAAVKNYYTTLVDDALAYDPSKREAFRKFVKEQTQEE